MHTTGGQQVSYKYLVYLAMFSMIIMPSSIVTTNKIISIGHQHVTAGSLILPLWYVLTDIMAEVYGYHIAKRVFYWTLVCQFFFILFCSAMIQLPPAESWQGQAAYELVFGNNMKLFFSAVVGFFVGGLLNIYCISKWKVLLRGRYFWLRSIGSSAIGQASYTAIGFTLAFGGQVSVSELWGYIIWAYTFKIVGAIILSGPATAVVALLKKAEGVSAIEQQVQFNPFQRAGD